jgi:hypothetical protein
LSLIFDNLKALEREQEPGYQAPAAWHKDKQQKFRKQLLIPVTLGIISLVVAGTVVSVFFLPESVSEQNSISAGEPASAPPIAVAAESAAPSAPATEAEPSTTNPVTEAVAMVALVEESALPEETLREEVTLLEETPRDDNQVSAIMMQPEASVAEPVQLTAVPDSQTPANVDESEPIPGNEYSTAVAAITSAQLADTMSVSPELRVAAQRTIELPPASVSVDVRDVAQQDFASSASAQTLTNPPSNLTPERIRSAVVPARQNVDALRSRFLLALDAGQYSEAEALLITLNEQLGSGSLFVQRMQAYYLLKTRQFAAAERAYGALLAITPDDSEARFNSGWLALQQGELVRAANQLRPLLNDAGYRAQVVPLMTEIDRQTRLRAD